MKLKSKLFDFLIMLIIVFCMLLLLLKPNIMAEGIAEGLLICGNVLIPSLFPFTILSVFLLECGVVEKYINKPLIFSVFVFILSVIGGYPIGAKITASAYERKIISNDSAERLLNVCVNAGPAFIITVCGKVIFGSTKLGILLFLAHILGSITLFVLNSKRLSKMEFTANHKISHNPSEAFVSSVATASASLINICSYVILFSGIIKFVDNNTISGFLEISNAVLNIKNVYLISFLLGFSGACIILQVISIGKAFINKPLKLLLYRVLHGSLSVVFLKLLLMLFPIELQTISNNIKFDFKRVTENTLGGLFLIFFAVMFIYSLDNKKYCGKFINDIW